MPVKKATRYVNSSATLVRECVSWFQADPHRLEWLLITLFPLSALVLGRSLLIQVLSFLIAFPLVDLLSPVINRLADLRKDRRQTLLSNPLYVDKYRTYPNFLIKVILIAFIGTAIQNYSQSYLALQLDVLATIAAAYAVIALLFAYYHVRYTA